MTEPTGLRLGAKVPDFGLATYDPVKDDFGKFSLAEQVKSKRWTILFFYPEDFTFVCATEFGPLAEQHGRFVTTCSPGSPTTLITHVAPISDDFLKSGLRRLSSVV